MSLFRRILQHFVALQDEENTDIRALADSFGSLTQVPDYESALMELEAGSADAVAMDEGVALTKQAQGQYCDP